jgi:hypothetical protein
MKPEPSMSWARYARSGSGHKADQFRRKRLRSAYLEGRRAVGSRVREQEDLERRPGTKDPQDVLLL